MFHGRNLSVAVLSLIVLVVIGCVPVSTREQATIWRSLRLQPGEEVVLRVDPGTDLIFRANHPLNPRDLTVGLSNGSGLVVYSELEQRDGVLVLSGAGRRSASALRISLSANATEALSLAVLAQDPTLATQTYAAEVGLPGKSMRVRTKSSTRGRSYAALLPNAPVSIVLTGPARLSLKTRQLFSDGMNWTRSYRVQAMLDGAPFEVIDQESAPDLSTWLDKPNADWALGYLQTATLDVPAGRHSMSFLASRPLLLAIDRERTQIVVPRGTIWSLAPQSRSSLDAQLCTAPADADRSARRMSRDNGFAGGGLVASAILARSSASNPADGQLRSLAEHILGSYTFYRDLAPMEPMGLRHEIGYAIDPASVGTRNDAPQVPTGLITPLLLERLVRAIFVELPPTGLTYSLPPREEASELRIVVDKQTINGAEDIFVVFDNGATQRLRILQGQDFPTKTNQSNPGNAGLARVAAAIGVEKTVTTLTSFFAQFRDPGPLLDVGTAELSLPPGVKRVEIRSKHATGVRIGLQYRAATTYRLDEEAYVGNVAQLGVDRSRNLFATTLKRSLECTVWLTDPSHCDGLRSLMARGSVPERELANDWTPMLRLLRARERAVFASVPPQLRQKSTHELPDSDQEAIKSSALAAEANGDWQAALALWSELARGGQGLNLGRAQLGQAEALLQLNEFFLAERLLKSTYLDAPNTQTRLEAFNHLSHLFTQAGNEAALTGLAAAEAARTPSPSRLMALAEALVADGAEDEAARILALLPSNPGETGLSAFYRAGWNRALLRAVSNLSEARAAKWNGLIAQRQGDYASARLDFSLAGAEGQEWLSALDRAQAGNTVSVLGPRRWEDGEPLIQSSAGVFSFVTPARAVYGRFYRATAAHPVTIEVMGPARLRIATRPVHPSADAGPLESWYRLRSKSGDLNVPITSNYPASGIRVYGISGVAGTAETQVLRLPAGRQHIEVLPWSGALLVSAEIESPLVPMSQPRFAGAGSAGTATTDLEPAQQLAQMLWQFETGAGNRASVLAQAANLAEHYHSDPAVSNLWNRFDRQSKWERVLSVESSAGLRSIPLAGYAPETPELRTRLALLPKLLPGERLVQDQDSLAVAIVNTTDADFVAEIALATLPTLPPSSVTFNYRLDDGSPTDVPLTAAAPLQEIRISVPEGNHVLRFSTSLRPANQFVRLRLLDESGVAVGLERDRTYDVATSAEPVQITMQGPAWLRISEYRDEGTVDFTRFVEPGLQTVVLHPPSGQAQALFRVFQLVPASEPPVPVQRQEIPVEAVPVVMSGGGPLPVCVR